MSDDERLLKAIMFTDIAGYTAIAQSSESRALELLGQHNRLLRQIFPKFGGREIKTLGDSFLVEFGSALSAVRCAVEIQSSLREHNEKSPDDWKINVRIGIHLGDIVRKGGDVFGDAVNIASRIQPLAEIGGICVSQQVYDQVQNKVEHPFEKLEQVELKNVKAPIDVYKLILLTEDKRSTNRGKADSRLRIAVLPFVNMSSSQDDEYFADGLTEELIAELAGVKGLSVISRTSVMHYKKSNKKILEIGKELSVGTVLEGSVRKAGNKIRITAQLIDSTNDDHLWADRFDRELSDIFVVQDEIAKNVTSALKSKLTLEASEKVLETKRTEDMVAYNLYLQGRYFWNKRSKEAVKKALELFQQVIERDPEFARAYSGIADCYSIMGDRADMPALEAFSKSNEAATKAKQLDPKLPEAHASLALTLLRNFDWEQSEAEFKEAIALNPSYASAHQWYAHLLLDLGRLPEAGIELEKACEADPLSPVILQNLAFYYSVIKEYRKAIDTVDRALEIHALPLLYFTRAYVNTRVGNKERALRDLEHYGRLEDSPMMKPIIGRGYAHLGMRDKALILLKETIEASKNTFIPASVISFLCADLGLMDDFFEWAYRAADQRTMILRVLMLEPEYAAVRGDPRFRNLLRYCRVPESVVAKMALQS